MNAAVRFLRAAEARIPLIATCTPVNLEPELLDLARTFPRQPRFGYRSVDLDREATALSEAARHFDTQGDMGRLFAARARELALEAQMCCAAGTPQLRTLAKQRYRSSAEADAIAARWSTLEDAITKRDHISDDDGDPQSLVRRMRAEVGRTRLPFRVEVVPTMAARAATGRGVILIAAGRAMSAMEVERTVVHEVEGHARPRTHAVGILEVGTAEGSDDQEGRALAIEQERGWLSDGRKRELALRHRAAESVRAGADFVETVRALDLNLREALRVAARAHRGGGLAREIAYLTGLVRFRTANPAERRILAHGRVSVAAAGVLDRIKSPDRGYHDEIVTNLPRVSVV